MVKKNPRKVQIDDAAEALKDLNMYYAIIALCENSLISAGESRMRTNNRIIELCKAEAGRCLAEFDRNRAAALRITAKMVDAMLDARYPGVDWRVIVGEGAFKNTRAAARKELKAAIAAAN